MSSQFPSFFIDICKDLDMPPLHLASPFTARGPLLGACILNCGPESERPRLWEVLTCENVSVIDLGCQERGQIAQQVGDACKNYGFFQTMRLSASSNVNKEKVHNWRDYPRYHFYPLDKYGLVTEMVTTYNMHEMRSASSQQWKGIYSISYSDSATSTILKNECYFKVGNGKTIKSWTSKWLQVGTSQSCFSWLYDVLTSKTVTFLEMATLGQILGTETLDGIGD
ncbi:hypothetical protein SADUNF_Sadunf12G0002600 [Salix dunnii]|uniref:Non-haem dioxygenase N-terminal domain-containing protein n=1 Tax=Salix dunnii TaxID=1413687 RepID=A0A835JM05_9ROSI|nr:hypothetical protein SADUNF_Sadunf12G0002600 [Salix dunnii]